MTEQTATQTEAVSVPGNLNLSCPFCGSELRINCEYTGSAYMQENTPESIECVGPFWCGAEWEPNGVLRTKANYIEYPSLYTRPADWTNG